MAFNNDAFSASSFLSAEIGKAIFEINTPFDAKVSTKRGMEENEQVKEVN